MSVQMQAAASAASSAGTGRSSAAASSSKCASESTPQTTADTCGGLAAKRKAARSGDAGQPARRAISSRWGTQAGKVRRQRLRRHQQCAPAETLSGHESRHLAPAGNRVAALQQPLVEQRQRQLDQIERVALEQGIDLRAAIDGSTDAADTAVGTQCRHGPPEASPWGPSRSFASWP